MYDEQQTPLHDVQPYQNHGNSYSSMIIVFLLGSCAIAVSVTPLLNDPTDLQFTTNIIVGSQYIGFLNMLLAVFICLGFMWKYKSWICSGIVRSQENRGINSDHLLASNSDVIDTHNTSNSNHSSYQIVLFGVGTIVYQVSRLVTQALQFYEPQQVIGIINSITFIICFSVYIMCLHKYNSAALKNCRMFHYSIAFLIGATVWSWILVTARPLWALSLDTDNTTTTSPGKTTCPSAEHTSMHPLNWTPAIVFDLMTIFLQPFYVEFLSITIECLINLWQSMRPHADTLSHVEMDEPSSNQTIQVDMKEDYRTIVDAEAAHSTADLTPAGGWSRRRRFHKCIFATLALIAVIIYCVMFVILIMGPFSGLFTIDLPLTTQNILMKCIQTAGHVVLIILFWTSLYWIQNSSENIRKGKLLTTEGYVLLLTTNVVFVYTLLKFIAAFKFPAELSIFFILFELIGIIRCWFQTQLIITAHYVHRSLQKLPKIVEYTLILIVAINLIEWAWISIMHKWIEDDVILDAYDPILVAAFGEVTATKVHLILDPLREVYAFHSAKVAFEVQKVKQIDRD